MVSPNQDPFQKREELRIEAWTWVIVTVICFAIVGGYFLFFRGSTQGVDPRAPMDPPSTLEWSSPVLKEQYAELYASAVAVCEAPMDTRQPQIDEYAKLRQAYVTDSVTVMDAPSVPTPEHLIGC